jgi:hypothetical protein
VPLLLVAGVTGTARGLLEEPLQPASSEADSANARVNRACMFVSFLVIGGWGSGTVASRD